MSARWHDLHSWNVSKEEARAIQRRLAPLVSHVSAIPECTRLVAGVDVSPPDARGQAMGAVALLSLPGLEAVQVLRTSGRVTFPYVSGLLSFREAPLMVDILGRLEATPDIVLVDGQGLAHPRRVGLACHVGVATGLSTVGCAKSILVGKHGPVGAGKGAWTPLRESNETVGAVVRTRENTRPVYVSIGHRVDLDSAVRWVLACCGRYRLPEPLRTAHRAARG